MAVPPPVDSNVPHLRLSRSLRQLHPESVAQLAPAPSFDVYQQLPGDEHEHERPESWALLGTYKLGAQCGWLSHSRIDDDGANIFLVDNETTSTALERIGAATPNEQHHEQPQHEQHLEQPQNEQRHEHELHELHHEQPEHEQRHEQPQHELHHEQPQNEQRHEHELHEQYHEQPQHEHEHELHELHREQPQHEQQLHEQPQHEQPQHEQPQHEQPQHEQLQHEQPQHEQPQHEQPQLEQPQREQPQREQPQLEQPQLEQPQLEQPQQVQSHLQTPKEEKSNPLLAAAAVAPAQVDTVAVQLPPTPPLASLEKDIAASYTRVPLTEQAVRALSSSPPDDDTRSASISLETMAVEIPQRKDARELYEPATPTAGSYADLCVSMGESQYSNISSANDDGKSDDGDESDRWSEISTGPVDRQWTVVFEEKDEMV